MQRITTSKWKINSLVSRVLLIAKKKILLSRVLLKKQIPLLGVEEELPTVNS